LNRLREHKTARVIPSILFLLLTILGCTSRRARIETSIGQLTVIKAEVVNEFVLGAGWSIKAQDGHQLLLVWFEGNIWKSLNLTTSGVYVLGDDGSTTPVASIGATVVGEKSSELKLLLPFYPPITATSFTLYWPNNTPVELALSK